MFAWICEYPESAICFLLALTCLFLASYFKKDFFSPASIYCFSQSLTLGIAYLKYNPAMTDFHAKTWFIWIGAMLSFLCGSWCVRLFLKSRNLPLRFCGNEFKQDSYNWKLHLALSFGLFLLYIAGVYGIIRVAGNLLLLTGSPSQWMTKSIDYGYWAILFNSSPLVVMFFGIASFRSINPERKIRWIARTMIPVVLVLNVFAYPNRGTIFFSLGGLLILFNYLKKKISPVLILVCLLVAAGAFIGISQLRSQYGDSVQNIALEAALDLPYKYVANNYWNLDYAANPPTDKEIHPHTYGIDFFAGIFDYFRLSGSIRNSMGWDDLFNERVQKVQGLNTTGYLWEVYKDLYFPGVFLFPFFCGVALSLLHSSLYRKIEPKNLLFYVMFAYFVAWWFFNHSYKQGLYWIWAVVIFACTTLCQLKQPKTLRSETLP